MQATHPKSILGMLEIEEVPGCDLFIVARYLEPIEAHMARGCLEAAGIPAVVADDNHIQANQLMSPAMGGVRVLVPRDYLQQSQETLAALARGDFAIDDDADVGQPE